MMSSNLTSETRYVSQPATGRYSVAALWPRALRAPRPVAVFYLLAITLILTTLVDPRLGLVLHGAILLSLLTHAALVWPHRVQRFLICLALAPLIRLVSLSLPLPDYPFVYWYFIVGAPLLLAATVAMQVVDLKPRMIGLQLRHGWGLQLLVGASGLLLGLVEYFILRPEPLVPEFKWLGVLLPALILLIFTGFLEEYIFRGLLQYTAFRSLGRYGVYYVAAVFAALHIGYKSLLDVVFVFLVAVYFGYVAHRSSSLLGVSLAHGLTNIALFLVFPFLIAAPAGQAGVLPSPPEQVGRPALGAAPATSLPRPVKTPARTSTSTPDQHATQLAATLTPEASPTLIVSPSPTLTSAPCQPREGWVPYVVQPGDTLDNFRKLFKVRKVELLAGGCLDDTDELIPGQVIYLPYVPPTPTVIVDNPAKSPAVPTQVSPRTRKTSPAPDPPPSRP